MTDAMDEKTLLRVLKAIGHPKRFRMVQEIAAAGEMSCGQIGGRFECSQPTISHHMKILVQAEVLIVREAGQQRIITVNRPLIDAVSRFLPGRLTVAARGRRPDTSTPTTASRRTRARPVHRTRT